MPIKFQKFPTLLAFSLIAFTSTLSISDTTAQAALPSIIEAPPELLSEEQENSGPLESSPPQALRMETFESARSAEPPAEAAPNNTEAETTIIEETINTEFESTVSSNDAIPFQDEASFQKQGELTPEPEEALRTQENNKSIATESDSHAPSNELIQALSTSIETEKEDSNEEILASLNPKLQQELKNLTEGLHREHQAIFNELRDDEELAISDLSMLWQAAVERSGAIRFAIEKLSRRNAAGQAVNQVSFTKRLLRNVTQLTGTAASIWTGTPAGVLGGGLVQDLMNGDPSVSAMSRVTDADMLILAKEVEGLQSKVIESYYGYRHAEAQWKLAKESKQNLGKYYADQYASNASEDTVDSSQSLQPVLDALYNGILLQEENAQRHYISSREHLGILVGAEAIIALEQTRKESAQR